MKVDQLIHFLEASSGSVPKLNNQIARLVGYTTTENPDPLAAKRTIWLEPNGQPASRIPDYTGNIDEAVACVDALAKPKAAAFAVANGNISARLDDGPTVYGATPAIALCIAAVKALSRNQ